jgi:hypothetical protein
VCVGGGPCPSEVLQVLERRQILYFKLYPQALRTRPLRAYAMGRHVLTSIIVECLCRTAAIMGCSEYGDADRILLHPDKCGLPGDIHARLGRTRTFHSAEVHTSLTCADSS